MTTHDKQNPIDEEIDAQGKDRRTFLQQFALAAAGISIAATTSSASASETSNGSRVPLQKPISWKLLKSESNKNAPVTENMAVIELIGSDGAKHVSNCYSRRVDFDGGHDDVAFVQTSHFANSADTAPVFSESRTLLTSTKYGRHDGNFRMDEVTVQSLDQTGRRNFPSMTVKVPIPNPYTGLSDQELVDKILSEKLR